MKFGDLPVYGDQSYRGDCKTEDGEHASFVAWLRFNHPEDAALLIHPHNEGKRTQAQISMAKKMGLNPGASDIIIPGAPAFVCEIKRKDHTKSHWQPGQIDYLEAAINAGCFVAVALGNDGAKAAFAEWKKGR